MVVILSPGAASPHSFIPQTEVTSKSKLDDDDDGDGDLGKHISSFALISFPSANST